MTSLERRYFLNPVIPNGSGHSEWNELMTALNQGFSRWSEAEPENYCRQSDYKELRGIYSLYVAVK